MYAQLFFLGGNMMMTMMIKLTYTKEKTDNTLLKAALRVESAREKCKK